MKRSRIDPRTTGIEVVGGIVLEEQPLDDSDFGDEHEHEEAVDKEEEESEESGVEEDGEDDDDEKEEERPRKKKKNIVRGLTKEQLAKFTEKQAARGVVHLSRVPPRMTPRSLRALLSQFGRVLHVHLRKESAEKRSQRRRETGISARRYTDGWVEFEDKKVARSVAASLNGTPIGGRRRCYYAQDLWVMEYLPGFTWDDLQDNFDRERENRGQRLKLAISRAKHENEAFLENLELSKRKLKEREWLQKHGRKHSKKDSSAPAHTHTAASAAESRARMIKELIDRKKKEQQERSTDD